MRIGWILVCQKITKQFKMINSRLLIKQIILEIESKFPVNNWKVGSIHLWPYIRIKLFFYLINSIEKKERASKKRKIKGLFELLKSIYRNYRSVFIYLSWTNSLPKKENLFVGADAHRVDYRNARFNRFFDVLIEKNKILESSMYFEYGFDSKNQYNKSSVFIFSEALKGFLFLNKFFKTKEKVSLDQYDDFLNFLKNDSLFDQFRFNNSNEKITAWANEIFYPKVVFFQNVLQKIQPTKMLILCYYSEDIFALTAAANRLNIKTIEMQHGPQATVHLAYSSWGSLPELGYDMLPRNYWCWDLASSQVIEKWTNNNENYSVKVVGNPWINYWQSKEIECEYSNYILYSLQPDPLTISQLFPESIVNFIKDYPYKWFIRLHPRQLDDLNKIKLFLKEVGVIDYVNIVEATSLPLPLLLCQASLHLTHFSGTAIEASMSNVFTVLLNEIGVLSFPELISAQKAVYLDFDDIDFKNKFEKIIQDNQISPKVRSVVSYQENLFN